MNIYLPTLRGLIIDIEIGAVNDREKIGSGIKMREAVRSWAILHRKLMGLVEELGDKIDRDSYFATDIIGTETLNEWRADPAGLRNEKEKLSADLTALDKLVATLTKGKR